MSSLKTTSDLAVLKAKDPFMYYSRPAVMEAKMQGKDLDLSAMAHANQGNSSIVKRSTRISCESSDIESLTGLMAQPQGDADAAAGSGLGAAVDQAEEDEDDDDLFMRFLGNFHQ